MHIAYLQAAFGGFGTCVLRDVQIMQYHCEQEVCWMCIQIQKHKHAQM